MSRMLTQRFAKSRGLLLGLSVISIFSIGHMFHDLTTKYKRIGQIQNGLQICGNRANQSYTASVIADSNSIYLDSNFTSATQECLAEATNIIEDSKFLPSVIAKKINALATNTHWFHESLRSTGTGFAVKQNDNSKAIAGKYATVEQDVSSIVESLESHGELLNNSLSNLKLALFTSGAILLIAGVWEVLDRRKLKLEKREIEDEAFAQLISEDQSTAKKVEEIIVNALELNEMVHCSKLITTYRQNVLKSNDALNSYNPMKELTTNPLAMAMVTNSLKNKEQVEEVAQKLWDESEEDQAVDMNLCEIESITTKVVDHLSNKLIADGIMVDMELNDSGVIGDSETLEQVVYYVLLDALKNTNYANEKKVSIRGKALGSVYNLEVTSLGKDKDSSDNTSIEISKEILADLGGRLEITNFYTDQSTIGGRKVKIIMLTKAKKSQPKKEEANKTLTRLEKGTKREILERMNA